MISLKLLNKREMNKWGNQTLIGLIELWEMVLNRKIINNVKSKEQFSGQVNSQI